MIVELIIARKNLLSREMFLFRRFLFLFRKQTARFPGFWGADPWPQHSQHITNPFPCQPLLSFSEGNLQSTQKQTAFFVQHPILANGEKYAMILAQRGDTNVQVNLLSKRNIP